MKINSNRIQLLMIEQAKTQGTLAEKAGVSRATINGALLKKSCRPATAGKIARALGVDPVDIIEMEEQA